MLRSMTGFGQAEASACGFKLQVDAKSVNHRYCEVAIRLPREWIRLEDRLKKVVRQHVRRGRVDVFVSIEREAGQTGQVKVDWAMAEGYVNAAAALKQRFGLQGEITLQDLLAVADLIRLGDAPVEDEEPFAEALTEALRTAVLHMQAMRETEGGELRRDIESRMRVLEPLRAEMAERASLAATEYTLKLRRRVAEMTEGVGIDEQRLAAEVALFADRANVDEELTRIGSHLSQIWRLLQSVEPVGRQLDFLLQKLIREANTVGSKSTDAALTALVVAMKAEFVKIREQAQNVE